MTHGCFDKVDAAMRHANTKLMFALSLSASEERLVVATEKVDTFKHGRPMRAMANYCPFCGAKL